MTNEEVGIKGFRLARKIGMMFQDEHVHGSVAMFAIAALAAYGIGTQRAEDSEEQEAFTLHMETVLAILTGVFNEMKQKANIN